MNTSLQKCLIEHLCSVSPINTPFIVNAITTGTSFAKHLFQEIRMITLTDKLREIEKEEILGALGESRCNMAKAARILGITERMIGYKIEKYGIKLSRRGDEEQICNNE